jgi:hypothetical protein
VGEDGRDERVAGEEQTEDEARQRADGGRRCNRDFESADGESERLPGWSESLATERHNEGDDRNGYRREEVVGQRPVPDERSRHE